MFRGPSSRRGSIAALAVLLLVHAASAAPTDEIRLLIDAGRHEDAQREARALLADVEREQGKDSLAVADVLAPLLRAELELLGRNRPDPELLELAARAVAIRERELGPRDLELARSLVALGRLEERAEHASDAVAHFERALAIQEAALGSDDAALAPTLDYLARSLRSLGQLERALAHFERTLALREKHFGRESLEASHSVNALANLTAHMGRYEESEHYFERLLAMREALLGPDDIEVAHALGNFAVLYLRQDDYARAVPLLARSLEIIETVRGPWHPDVAHGLGNLGIMSMRTGDFALARTSLERSLAIRERNHGAEHVETIMAVSQLAVLLWKLGDYEHSRVLHQRASDYWERAEGNVLERAGVLNNFALLLSDMGDYAEARRLYETSLALKEQALGPVHRDVAHTLNNLGVLRFLTGDPEGARPLLERALAIDEEQLGTDHVSTAGTLVALGQVLAVTGSKDDAKDRFERALSIQEERLGAEHPDVATTLTALGSLLADLGRTDDARDSLERARRIREASFGVNHPLVAQDLALIASLALGEDDRAQALEAGLAAERIGREHAQIAVRALAEREALSYAAVRGSGLSAALSVASTPAGVTRVWDSAIRSRALVLDEMLRRRRALAATHDPEVARLARDLETARRRMAHVVVRGPGDEEVEDYLRVLDYSRREKERAERALAEQSAVFRADEARRQPGLTEVRQALPERTALVAYVRYEHGAAAVASYLAFVLPSPESSPLIVRLGPADAIDALIASWREEARTRPPAMKQLRESAERSCRDAGHRLREKVWDPIRGHLGQEDLALVVADGSLSFVDLAALPAPEGGYLLESDLRVHLLATERDLLPEATERHASGLLLVGDPDYGEGAPVRFAPLPAAAAEIDEIAELWKSERGEDRVDGLEGKAANEASFKKLASGRRVLHLATHAYAVAGEDPLAMSGLALAGANGGGSRGSEEDGVLTAEEVVSLDLSGLEWVVLSACETGLGQFQEGEGILGLGRAFRVAGARTLVKSLWSVQDEATRAWMAELYRARLDGESTAEAVRRASLRVLEARQGAGLSTHPFYWGAFVAEGDWR